MLGPESLGASPAPQEEGDETINEGRRNFFKRAGGAIAGAALGSVGLGMAETAEARREKPQNKVGYVGFRPNSHQKTYVETRLSQIAPGAVSTEIRVIKSGDRATMVLSLVSEKGGETEITTNPFTLDRSGDYIMPALREVLDALEMTSIKSERVGPDKDHKVNKDYFKKRDLEA